MKLALRDSPARESEPSVSPSHPDGLTAQPPPSPPTSFLSGLSSKVGASPTPPPQITPDLPDTADLEVESGQGEDGASSEPGEVVSPPCTRIVVPSLPPEEKGTGSHQSPSVVMRPNPILTESREVEHTLRYGEQLAGFTQAQLPLSSRLTPSYLAPSYPRGD